MCPESNQNVLFGDYAGQAQQHSLDHTREVTQVEQVVRLCRRGEKVDHCALVHAHSCRHDWRPQGFQLGGKALREVPGHDAREDEAHRLVRKLVYGDRVEVPEEPGGDWISAPTGGPHGGNDLYVHQVHSNVLFEVVPVPVVEPLAQEFYGGLGAVGLTRRHVQVIHKHQLCKGKTHLHALIVALTVCVLKSARIYGKVVSYSAVL